MLKLWKCQQTDTYTGGKSRGKALILVRRTMESGFWAGSLLNWRSLFSAAEGLMALHGSVSAMANKRVIGIKYFFLPGVPSSWAGPEHPPLFPGQSHCPYLYHCSSLASLLLPWFSLPHTNPMLTTDASLCPVLSVLQHRRISGPGPVYPSYYMGLPISLSNPPSLSRPSLILLPLTVGWTCNK